MSDMIKNSIGELYVIGTPIGNLSDCSKRMVETLEKVDFIAAEDTRVSQKLLNYFNIKKPMISYYEHNLREKGNLLLERMLNGEVCGIISDAGMPCISDPGEDLVHLCRENNVPVYIIPGPCACVSALAISGLKTFRFAFEGFLSMNKNSRLNHLLKIKNDDRTLIFYEAPHKLINTLKDLYLTFGNRKISIIREMTKIYEEVIYTNLEDAIKIYKGDKKPKGEFVLVVEGCSEIEEQFTVEQAVSLAKEYQNEGMSASEAAKTAAKECNMKKSDIYKKLI